MNERDEHFASCQQVRASIYRSLGDLILKPEEIKYYWRHEAEQKIARAIGQSKLVSEAIEDIIAGKDQANYRHFFGRSDIDFAVDPPKRNSDRHFDGAMQRLLNDIPSVEIDTSDPETLKWRLMRSTSDPSKSMSVEVTRTTEPASYPDDPQNVFERVRYNLFFGYQDSDS